MTTFGQKEYHERYRPLVHFSPMKHWTNDPNGMVYYKGIYHLFFQYNPAASIWGPMHWGHAVSRDLIHWKQLPVALYPDSLGNIYSGSAVVDFNNTSGFGSKGAVPLVAIFTSHDPVKQKAHANNYENESVAYSLDNGMTWKKYAHNPVLENPGISDFRDPKVFWYSPGKKWIMTLATKDRVTFYSSRDLKAWKRESDFGARLGAHGGVWECPDLFPLVDKGRRVWVLIVNINPGGPNKGSGTQYFIGNFDGHQFVTKQTDTKWIDYGPDDYAGVTWNNTGNRRIFLGWMSNWLYANQVPTTLWRNAMTLPRVLTLKNIGNEPYVASYPVEELDKIERKTWVAKNLKINRVVDLSSLAGNIQFPCKLGLLLGRPVDFTIILSNKLGERLVIGYNSINHQYFIDRRNSGITDFQSDFSTLATAPRISKERAIDLSLVIDESSVELFGDKGLSVMTSLFFPKTMYDKIEIRLKGVNSISELTYSPLKSIWH